MGDQPWIAVIQNMTLILSLVWLISRFDQRFVSRKMKRRNTAIGACFGLVGLIGMLLPVTISDGVILDGKAAIVVLSALFTGWRGMLVTAAILLAGRYALGGTGMEAGLLQVAGATVIGTAFRYIENRLFPNVFQKRRFAAFHSLLIGLCISSLVLMTVFVLPPHIQTSILRQYSLYILFIYPVLIYISRWMIQEELDRIALQQHLHRLAYTDSETHLPNRAGFQSLVDLALAEAEQHDKWAIVKVQVEPYQNWIHMLQPGEGERLMLSITDCLREDLPEQGRLARTGELEFSLLIPCFSKQEVYQHARRLEERFEQGITLGPYRFYLAHRIGIALYPEHGRRTQELCAHAEIAVSKYKESHSNRIVFFHEDIQAELRRRLEIEQWIRDAMKQQRFYLMYQPQVDLNTQLLVGFEALIRWDGYQDDFFTVSELIEVSEETGLIVGMGEWILRRSCELHHHLYEQTGHRYVISVNLSAIQLKHPEFMNMIETVIQEVGIEPSCLNVEITENILIHSVEEVRKILRRLHRLGICISLDDFGKGYSSLMYLKELPIQFIKLDKSFIQKLPSAATEACIVEAVLRLAHQLGLKVVAEGLEKAEQYQYLRQLGCDIGQGYYFSAPLDHAQLLAYIQQERT
ncbi:putative bifunctional diguanylate cyclase/phosphodiesterase [Marinicrinis sediminis]|uniref:Bifunctional diguanylate cyclase/phosphodiesterase n=1 Tax=Marinicrinis sediminis TaxID=1652465 RepID=A0ABW5RF37_9BACL